MDTLVTAINTTLDDNYNMLVDYKEEEDEGDNKDNSPVTTILTTAQILEIDSSLQISNMCFLTQEAGFFPLYIQPFLLYSMLGTLRQWSATSSTNRFIHASWFLQWGFRKAFLYAFETAFTRLPYQRIIPHVDIDTTLPTLSLIDIYHRNIPLNLFWSIDLRGYGSGYCGYRSYTLTSDFYRLILPSLLSHLLTSIKEQTPTWPWNKRRSHAANIELVQDCFSIHSESFSGGILDFNKIQLHDTKSNYKVRKVKDLRVDSKQVLYLVGFRYYYTREMREQHPDTSRLLYEPYPPEEESVEVSPPSTVIVEPIIATSSLMLDTVDAAIRNHPVDTLGNDAQPLPLQLVRNNILLGKRYDELVDRFNNLEREHGDRIQKLDTRIQEQDLRILELEGILKETRFTRSDLHAIPFALSTDMSPVSSITSPNIIQ